jgi:cation transporter-like permease
MSVQDAVSDAVSGVANESAEVKAAVGAAAATAAIPTPPPPVVGTLWMILIAGLVLAVLGSLVGVVWVVVDGKEATDPDVIVTIFTTTLAGLLGLFVKSPTSGG